MLYLLWAILNIGLFIFFIFLCFKATNLIKTNLGLLASIIFALGLVSFVCTPKRDNSGNGPQKIQSWKLNRDDSLVNNATNYISVPLEKNMIAKYKVNIWFGRDKKKQLNFPMSATSTTDGYICGILWKPSSIEVKETNDNNKFEYDVEGELDWTLLGLAIFSQSKKYKGVVSITSETNFTNLP